MKILLHSCCGPCAISPLSELQKAGHEVYAYFYNPNIHPYTEFIKRLDTFTQYVENKGVPSIINDEYELEEFLRRVSFREGNRCSVCYDMRLRKAAQVARKGRFDAFTTTLLVSPMQKHDLIREIGTAIGNEQGIAFYYQDFRPGYRDSVIISKEEEMYRQQYCGCIYSEKERYAKAGKKSKGDKR